LNSDEKLFFGRGNYFTFPEVHPNGWTVRKLRGTPLLAAAQVVVVADVADDERVEWAAFAAGQAAVVEDAGDLGVGVVVE